ncbi:hypothetical protein FIBSPDRAFT_951157 [Athelia psychrophila]|uniref:Carbamoyl phosphate synthase ATP-binding domain-containing protein n=1 Tax=Athelia psychrophila TaxID=1759441 RepID=A0A166MW92_9AGAM|nr:hypothetical protein FIBSPDRAFT_951157 [Fibularhizoctonia sp. CBS 109695]
MHTEVQIVGDATEPGPPMRTTTQLAAAVFQKVVEVNGALHHLPPSHEIQLSPTRRLDEDGTGTFEYLVNFHTGGWVFLEINPRTQVKHTVTERKSRASVSCASSLSSLPSPSRPSTSPWPPWPPQSCAIHLRLTAEDPAKDFRLSAELYRVARGAWGARRYVAFRCALLRANRGLFAVGEDRGGTRAGFRGDNAAGGACLRETGMWNDNEEGRIGTGFIVRQAWIGRRESTLGGDLGIAGNAAWRDIPPGRLPAWIQRHLRREKHILTLASIAYNAFPTHILGTLQAPSRLPPSRSRSSEDSPLPASQLAYLALRIRTMLD